MPTTPVAPPSLESLIHMAIEQVIKNADDRMPFYVLETLKFISAMPISPTYQVAMAAMKLAIHEALVQAAARAQMKVVKPGRIAFAVKYNYRPPPPEEDTEITIDLTSLLELEKLFV